MEAAGIDTHSSSPQISPRSDILREEGANLAEEVLPAESGSRDIDQRVDQDTSSTRNSDEHSHEFHSPTVIQEQTIQRQVTEQPVSEDERNVTSLDGVVSGRSDHRNGEGSGVACAEQSSVLESERGTSEYNNEEESKRGVESHRPVEEDAGCESRREGCVCSEGWRRQSSSPRDPPWPSEGRREDEEELEALMQELAELNPLRSPRPEGSTVSASACPS